MSQKPSQQTIDYIAQLAENAKEQEDFLTSNVAWGLKMHLRFGRPEVQSVLAEFNNQELVALVRRHRQAGFDLDAAWRTIDQFCLTRLQSKRTSEQKVKTFSGCSGCLTAPRGVKQPMPLAAGSHVFRQGPALRLWRHG